MAVITVAGVADAQFDRYRSDVETGTTLLKTLQLKLKQQHIYGAVFCAFQCEQKLDRVAYEWTSSVQWQMYGQFTAARIGHHPA